MDRRAFLAGAAALATAPVVASCLPPMPLTGEVRSYGSYLLERRQARPDAPNILMIVLDDQNDWLGFLNPWPGTLTPNLDALAARSIVFDSAYCTVPLCRPSRLSTMFGRMPQATGVYDIDPAGRAAETAYANAHPSVVDDLWAAGYDVYGAGKVFPSSYRERWTAYEQVFPWGQPWAGPPYPKDPSWINPYTGLTYAETPEVPPNAADFGPSGVAPAEEPDALTGAWAEDLLAAEHDAPFFLAYGIVQPHTPWRVSQQFFDQHAIDDVVVPDLAAADLDDLGPYARDSIIDQTGRYQALADHDLLVEAVQAYQAATTFVDWCVGQVLDELAAGPHADTTAVVVWSDHGHHLGEKLHAHKLTLWERSCRVPLLVSLPGQLTQQRVATPVSLVDVSPTVASLASATQHAPQDGVSLIRKVLDPSLADAHPPVTTWLEGNDAVRSGSWRYIRYQTGEHELYDHTTDPDERVNLSGDPTYASVIAELAARLPT